MTKEKGQIKDLIIKEINSIVDKKEIPVLKIFIKKLIASKEDVSILEYIMKRVEIEETLNIETKQEEYIQYIDAKFKRLTPKIVDYRTSKMDNRINTIRHGFNMLARKKQWEKLKQAIVKEKDYCNIDNDFFIDSFNEFLTNISVENVIQQIKSSFEQLNISNEYKTECEHIIAALSIYTSTFDETLNLLYQFCDEAEKVELDAISEKIRLYKIEKPFIANASNYGVPQNRERVLFIGCRKDQKFISEIPPTVREEDKVTIFEALYDLDFIGNNEEAHHYQEVNIDSQYNGTAKEMKDLLKLRSIDGKTCETGKTYAQWSKEGRLIERYKTENRAFYVKNHEGLQNGEKYFDILNNHKTSNQSKQVIDRLKVILKNGDYKKAKLELEEKGLASKKRNYNVLKPDKQSSTIMTMPDDYIHYNSPRALTVREMARLQSFDDSFVFQGKRSTGGNNRKSEVPQYTLVGNAVPPLLARAVATEILKHIK